MADNDVRVAQQLGRQLRLLGYEALIASDLETALELAEARGPGLILANPAMCPGGTSQLMHALDAVGLDCAVVWTTDEPHADMAIDAMREGAMDVVRRPIDQPTLVLTLQRLANVNRARERTQQSTIANLRAGVTREHLVAFMVGLANVIDAKSQYTREHSDRVAHRSKVFARYLNLPDQECETIAFGAKLHDIGKVAVPDAILNSPNQLTPEEWEIMQRHPSDGAKMLRPVRVMADIVPIAERHHENWDGTGYPDRMRGEEIPFGARLVKLVDYYDAITSVRPYRTPLPEDKACQVLLSEAGRQLDPELTEQFVSMVSNGLLRLNNVSAVIPAEHRFAAR
ncbi:MAG: HD domain-containing phosphohydrolase [Planctomycetota bacterium]